MQNITLNQVENYNPNLKIILNKIPLYYVNQNLTSKPLLFTQQLLELKLQKRPTLNLYRND